MYGKYRELRNTTIWETVIRLSKMPLHGFLCLASSLQHIVLQFKANNKTSIIAGGPGKFKMADFSTKICVFHHFYLFLRSTNWVNDLKTLLLMNMNWIYQNIHKKCHLGQGLGQLGHNLFYFNNKMAFFPLHIVLIQ